MCQSLQEQGIEILLVTTDAGLQDRDLVEKQYGLRPSLSYSAGANHGPKNGAPLLVNDYRGVPALFFRSEFGESFKYSRPLGTWLRFNIRNFDLVHIHAVFNYSTLAAAQVCGRAGVPYVIRPLGTLDPWSMSQKSIRKRVFWQLSGRRILQGAAAVHYTSDAEKLSTERLLGLNHGKVVPLGINAAGLSSREKLAREFPEFGQGPYVLALSRLHPKKGLDVLLEAFLLLIEDPRFAHWRLVIAGDGPIEYVTKLKRRADASLRRESIRFTGWLDDDRKAVVLSGASLLVLPSHQENFGLSVMEALSHSVPVLVSPHVNVAAEIAVANAGWVAAVDRNALAKGLSEALTDEAELERRGRAGKQLSQKYSWENAARELSKLYRELLI